MVFSSVYRQLVSLLNIRSEGFKIGNINAKQVRIYKISTFDMLTDEERNIYDDKSKKREDVDNEIREFQGTRTVRESCLHVLDKKGKIINENYKNQVTLFENDIIRLAENNNYSSEVIVDSRLPLLEEIIYLKVAHNDIFKQIIDDGVLIDGKKYIVYSATTGQVRNQEATLIQEEFYNNNEDNFLCGLTLDKINAKGGCNTGKFIAYKSLPLSSSIARDEYEIDIDKCIVVDDFKTVVSDMVHFLDVKTLEFEDKVMPIDIDVMDGAGIFLPNELPSSCQIRGRFIKGCLFPFDFRKFAKEIAGNIIIKDVKGEEVNIIDRDIRFILTKSQVKMIAYYDSWEEYKEAFKRNNLKLSINSFANSLQDTVRLAYQYLQTLDKQKVTDEDIKKLCSMTVEHIKNLHKDKGTMLKAVGAIEAEGKILKPFQEALSMYPQLINHSWIKKHIEQIVRGEKHKALAGKIVVEGFYCYTCPDLYAFCEWLFMGIEKPKGLIPINMVYNAHYAENEKYENVCCLRSPHLSAHEYAKRKLIKSNECKDWFYGYDTVVSSHDLISKYLMCDWDGDEILITPSSILFDISDDVPPLYYEMSKAKPTTITNDTIYNTLKTGFENSNIGEISNAITKEFNKRGSPNYDLINVLTAKNNYVIDYPKTGVDINLGRYEVLYKHLKNDTKPPCFFRWAKNKKEKSCNEAYLGTGGNVVDRINYYIEKHSRYNYTYFENEKDKKFNPEMLKNNELNKMENPKYKVNTSDEKYIQLEALLRELKDQEQTLSQANDCGIDYHDKMVKFDIFTYHCSKEILKIFTNKYGFQNENLAANYMVDIEFYNKYHCNKSKNILFNCFGHVIVNNIKRNLTLDKEVKSKPRMSYVTAKKSLKHEDEFTKSTDKRILDILDKTVNISEEEMELINDKESFSSVTKKGKLKYNANDRLVFFVLLCLFKARKDRTVDYFYVSKKAKRKVTANLVNSIAGVKSFDRAIIRLKNYEVLDYDYQSRKHYKIWFPKFQDTNADKNVLEVKDVYNSLPYLYQYTEEKTVSECVFCKKLFVKEKNSQKTCSENCSKTNMKIKQDLRNEKRKNIEKV